MLMTRREPSDRRGRLHEHVDGAGDLLADRDQLHVGVGERDHHLKTGDGVTRRVGVHGGKRAVVTGVHRLEHVERLGAADLADDDAVRPAYGGC